MSYLGKNQKGYWKFKVTPLKIVFVTQENFLSIISKILTPTFMTIPVYRKMLHIDRNSKVKGAVGMLGSYLIAM